METEKIAEIITPIRLKILKMLGKERHPGEIAVELHITRQGVDKHLAMLYRYGLVDKRVKMEARPMVFYRITPEGEEFLRNFEDMAQSHIMSVRNRYKEELLNLDRMLVEGKINEAEYWRKRRELQKRFQWVMSHGDKER